MEGIARLRRSRRVLQGLQAVYAVACIALAIPLVFDLGPAANVTNGTSVRILAAALLTFAVGALWSAVDPRWSPLVVRLEIVFTALASGMLLYRLVVHAEVMDRAWILLPPVVLCLVLLLVLLPATGAGPPRTGR